jgi:hypothetical protein
MEAQERAQALPAGDRGRALVVSGRVDQPAHKPWCSDATAVTQGVERPEQGTVVEDAAAAAVAWSKRFEPERAAPGSWVARVGLA